MFGVKERGVVGRVAYRPLLIGVQEVVSEDVQVVSGVRQPLGHGDEVSHHVWWVRTSHALTVALWDERLQSSPLRILTLPFSSSCKMVKDVAAKTFSGPLSTKVSMSATLETGRVWTGHQTGALAGPRTRPRRVSSMSSVMT